MINLLIDTCSLIHLVDKNGYNPYLIQLKNLIENKKIRLLSHELILQEWENHKTKIKKDELRKLNRNNNKIDLNSTQSLIPANPFQNLIHFDIQIRTIDDLLKNSTMLKTTEAIKFEFSDRYQEKKAPFHKGGDQQKDWYILGSACSHCELNAIPILFFISHNHNHFADINEPKNTIHPDFQERFNALKINYYKNYSECINELQHSGTSLMWPNYSQQVINENYSYKSSIKGNPIDSLLHIYNNIYKEINFVPHHILKKYFPFTDSDNSDVYYNIFTFYNVQDILVEYFDNVVIDENKDISFKDEQIVSKIEDAKNKTLEVLQKLTKNLVFNLQGKEINKTVNIHYHKDATCECARCTYNRFEFHHTFSSLKNPSSDLMVKLQTAYIHYQIGNFESAVNNYFEIVDLAKKEKQYITYFIARYNLKHLSRFLDNPFHNKHINLELINKINDIDPIEDATKLKSLSDYNLLTFIAQEDFFTNSFQAISKSRDEILDHYHSQLNGGWSRNSHIWHLIEEFAKLDTFLNLNYIIFDEFSNFSDLFEIVTEAIFASYAINEKQGDRFTHFDDYWSHKFIVYGKRKTILKFLNRFKIKSLKYKPSGSRNDSFIDLAKNLFLNEHKIRSSYQCHADQNNEYFDHKVNDIFENILTLASILDLDQKSIIEFSKALLTFLKKETTLARSSFSSIKDFINKKFELLPKRILLQYLNFFKKDKKFHEQNFWYLIVSKLPKSDHLSINEKDFTSLIDPFVLECKICNRMHTADHLCEIFDKFPLKYKRKIVELIDNSLKNNFKFSLYYLCSLYDVIKFDPKKLKTLIKGVNCNVSKSNLNSEFWGTPSFNNPRIDELFNLCFKFKINTKTKAFTKFESIHPYYKWLINMEKFDYSKFDVSWTLHYHTVYYENEMAKSKKLISHLFEYLKNNSDKQISNLLLRIMHKKL